jgi:hypothetical protein
MRILTAAVVIGPLMLSGALPAAAGSSVFSDTSIQLAAVSDAPSDRDTYTRKAQDEMQAWQKKLHDFSVNARAKGQEASNAAGQDLNEAWTKTEAASRDLQSAGDEGWARAKISYEHASHDLAEAWHKANPDDK